MEKELQQMLNARFGYGTWDELKEMRRKIRAQREKEVYKQAEARQSFINGIAIVVLTSLAVCVLVGMVYLVGVGSGRW